MRMQKRKFRIGELAKKLEVERFVIRFWEKEFNLKTIRSNGGQRFYDENDLATFEKIKELLYQKGFTIAGAKKQLASLKTTKETVLASKKTELQDDQEATQLRKQLQKQKNQFEEQITDLKKKLSKLRELL